MCHFQLNSLSEKKEKDSDILFLFVLIYFDWLKSEKCLFSGSAVISVARVKKRKIRKIEKNQKITNSICPICRNISNQNKKVTPSISRNISV